jgi:hypothetical protein
MYDRSFLLYRIANPLAGIPRKDLLSQVDAFAQQYNLGHILPVLRKGALVAQNPPEFETIAELTDEERTALRNEVDHKWRQPRALYFTIILCSVGAAVQ